MLITSSGMDRPSWAKCNVIPVEFDDPNDVGPAQLLRFELAQRRRIRSLLGAQRFDVVHRVTPSGYKDSLLPPPDVPLILGPVLGSDPPPESFRGVFHPRLPRTLSLKALTARIKHGVARRVFQRYSTLDQLLARATVIIAGTEVTRRRLPAQLQPRCQVVTYAGVEHDVFTPPPAGRANGTARLLFVGRMVPYKGVELLIRAAAQAIRRCRFELLIAGGGHAPYLRYCQDLVEDLGLWDTVNFAGRQPRESLVELYRSADVFCMPSIETYGIAILEAMSCGCATLVADLNGPGEIVRPGTGVKVALQSPEQFIAEYADRIVELIEDDRRRRELGERARDHVVRCHDWSQIEAACLGVYERLFERETASTNRSRAAVQPAL